MDHLESLLTTHRKQYRHAVIISESVFSMDGDISPISELIRLKRANDAQLMIDDAHGVGMYGENGYGVLENIYDIDIAAGTFGKALGSYGGYVACSKIIADYLVNHCRFFIYSTALPEELLKWNLNAWQLLPTLKSERDHVHRLAKRMRQTLSEKWECLGQTHIVPVLTKSADEAKALETHLKSKGFWVHAIRPPTVPENACRLRFSLTAHHTEIHIMEVCHELNAFVS